MDRTAADDALREPSLYVNRELSWLAFNERVLDQARDQSWPLLERIKFLAIFGANLDEFFMIRVSGLHEQLESRVASTAPDGLSPREQCALIRSKVLELNETAARLWADELSPALAENGIRIRRFEQLSATQQKAATAYFRRAVFPVLTPLAVDPIHPFPFLSNLSLSLAVEAENPRTLERRFARVKVPESLPRFIRLDPDSGAADAGEDYVPLEELIAGNLADLFPGTKISGPYPFRVTRDMDLDILEDEAADLLSLIDREIRKRRFGAAVRIEVAPEVPAHIRQLLLGKLELDAEDLYETRCLLGFSGLMGLLKIARPELHDPPLSVRVPPELDEGADPFAAIKLGDVFLHHPYDSFAPVLHFLQRAADDPNVLAIKMTLYRAGSNAEAVRALIRAGENGKQVAVSIELKARFDEENNIVWARALERAGVHVFYGAAGLKTHAKILLVVRREGAELRRYVHLATGNYNATTARLYTDTALLTVDPAIGEDASELFNSLSGFSTSHGYRKLAVAPLTLRKMVLGKIDEQTARAEAGKSARVFAKLNALVDPEIIRALYRASQAGVQIELVVRGICCLRPRQPGISENIRVHSLLGRFLEHERIFLFGPEGQEEFYLASADWMQRNLDRRVEIMFPIESAAIRARIRQECLVPVELDNSRVYEMQPDGSYVRRAPKNGDKPLDAQLMAWKSTSKLGASAGNGSTRALLER